MYLTFVSQILNDKEKAKDIIALAKGNNNIGARNENAMKKIENEYKDELRMNFISVVIIIYIRYRQC